MTPEENVQRLHNMKLQEKIELMQKLATRQGFFDHYFATLRTVRERIDAFNVTNDLYFELFNEYRYADYHTFKRMIYYYNNKSK